MTRMVWKPLCLGIALLTLVSGASAQEPLELLKFVPMPVNTVAVVNVKDILATPRAVKEGWAKQNRVEFLAGAVPLHPSIERIVLAKEMHPEAPGQGGVLAVIPLTNPLDITKFANSRGGSVDSISDEPAALLSNQTVGLKLADKVLGLIRSTSRQDATRWQRYNKTAKESLQGKFINSAIYNAGTRNHILIAIDTEDLFHPQQIASAVGSSNVLKENPKVSAAIEAYLVKLIGVRFTANIKADGIYAEVRVESGATAPNEGDALKVFFMERLDLTGAGLEDLSTATVKASGTAVTLSFRISDPELAKIMSLITIPADPIATDEVVAVAPAGVNAAATQKYYREVNKILDDLKEQNKRAKEYRKTAVWHETAAQKIQALSVMNVEPLVIEYAHSAAARLHRISDSLKGVPIQAAELESKLYAYTYSPRTSYWYGGRVRINPWAYSGGYNLHTNIPQIREQEAKLIREDEKNRTQLWSQMEVQKSELRAAVLQKTGIDVQSASPR